MYPGYACMFLHVYSTTTECIKPYTALVVVPPPPIHNCGCIIFCHHGFFLTSTGPTFVEELPDNLTVLSRVMFGLECVARNTPDAPNSLSFIWYLNSVTIVSSSRRTIDNTGENDERYAYHDVTHRAQSDIVSSLTQR